MPSHPDSTRAAPSVSPGDVLALFRSGSVSSRADVARHTGLAASTAATRVDELVKHGYLHEAGKGESLGGRRPRQLVLTADAGLVIAVDLGARHATFGLLDMAGALVAHHEYSLDIAQGAEAVLRWILERAHEVVAANGRTFDDVRGFGLGLPGPVDSRVGALISPSRMPGWNGLNAAQMLSEISGVPVVVDNDANLMALGEYVAMGDSPQHMVFVKAGSSIGCGVIAAGVLHHGHTGIAGDISHVSLADGPAVICSCGRTGCLDAVAGGAAIVRDLNAADVPVTDIAGILALASDAHPIATAMLRTAGRRTGTVLATIVNFFNPQRLVLGGQLCQAEAFVAGVRSSIYTECLPMATDQLEIVVSRTGQLGGVLGAGHSILDRLFDPQVIDNAIRAGD